MNRSLLPPRPLESYEDYMRAENLDLQDMSPAELALELEALSWLSRHYGRRDIWQGLDEPITCAAWARKRAGLIVDMLAAAIPPARPEPKTAPKTKRTRKWRKDILEGGSDDEKREDTCTNTT